MNDIKIFTDGACSGNPGPGGWGAVLYYNDSEKCMSGAEKNTTNNRMELMATVNLALATSSSNKWPAQTIAKKHSRAARRRL